MKKIFLLLSIMLCNVSSKAFCGFYVAKADAKLFNKSSQVIMVRDGNKTTITMANDYIGNVKDFAMVVPVPTVLTENDIFVLKTNLFEKLDAYSAPRLVEYYDENPCNNRYSEERESAIPTIKSVSMNSVAEMDKADLGVTIEAKFSVGEYDILILSATESNGLATWLIQNGYKIPPQANEVLTPYIKSNMKFFVVKVNLEAQQSTGTNKLRPIQLKFESPKFMLPIRLGMANSNGFQDLIIYTISKIGRVECTNYRTAPMPTGQMIPEFIKNDFGNFYQKVFNTTWKNENMNTILLEYAWNISSNNYVKCDPCVGNPPDYNDIADAGANSAGALYFTRLHVRYDRAHYAQDLIFQETPNQQNFQVRYVITHTVTGNLNCTEANAYYKKVLLRRYAEIENLNILTANTYPANRDYIKQYESLYGSPIEDDRKIRAIRKGGFDGGGEINAKQDDTKYTLIGFMIIMLMMVILRMPLNKKL